MPFLIKKKLLILKSLKYSNINQLNINMHSNKTYIKTIFIKKMSVSLSKNDVEDNFLIFI